MKLSVGIDEEVMEIEGVIEPQEGTV